jgi:hypothetical protein
VRGTRRGSSFTGDPKNMQSKVLEMDVCIHRGPAFGEMERRFPRAFERKDNFFLFRRIFIRNLRDV